MIADRDPVADHDSVPHRQMPLPGARSAGKSPVALVVLPGEGHEFKKDPARVGEVVARWLLSRRSAAPLR
ncbi:hypothetical protein OHB01_30305 [Microbispora hainanensis]|uniref:Peptidase S9 prolyl oligopeptidase catalytic domain-containing protein n=1 Tax=Microbispora hainanensis TaxID=568844 RepID=A0ABZ1T3F1_9ACTN|nr:MULTISPECIES: hypothetical protein [Microbispora]NJP24647.1 hypothetical protein [Microbispora sp. CL1-1]TQS14770.1 hypothetical protein FLW53_10565 [Microbispora sp. SCL1-1]